MKKPIIGILGNTYNTENGKFYGIERMYVNSAYVNGVLRNGGIPVSIPASAMVMDPEAAISMCDGLLFPGGEDMHPSLYGEEPIPELGGTREEIDRAWFAVGKVALEKKIPIFGICKGIQTLNVLCGGTLYQDIYAQREKNIGHMQSVRRDYTYHSVEVPEGTHMAEVLGAGSHKVNSMHHQAVRKLGENLRVCAVAPSDGTIEAVESLDGQILAVQWHPEGLIDRVPESNKLFADLVQRSLIFRDNKID